jgi:hypothetical protein
MKPKIRGWKEGVLTQDLRAFGGSILYKGETVRYKRYKSWNDLHCWDGRYEYHYTNLENNCLIRSNELLINE